MEQTEMEPLTREEILSSFTTEELLQEMEVRAKPSTEATEASKEFKKKGQTPVYIRVANIEFLYRSLARKEWRKQSKEQNLAITEAGEDLVQIAEVREDSKEKMVKYATLWSSHKGKDLPAGAVEVLADLILLESGFGPPESEPLRM